MLHHHSLRIILVCHLTLVSIGAPVGVQAQEAAQPVPAVAADTAQAVDSTHHKKNIIQKLTAYFANANKPKPHKKFDFSIIGGPHYSDEVKFGLGMVAAGLYSMDRADSALAQSTVALYGDITTTGSYVIGIRGNNYFPHDKYRLNYQINTISRPTDFWGIGYANGSNDANRSTFTRKTYQLTGGFLMRLAPGFYAGPDFDLQQNVAKKMERPDLLNGQDEKIFSAGLGFSVMYDTRDFDLNAFRGVYLRLDQWGYTSFKEGQYGFGRTEFVADYYHPAWKGAVLAFDAHALLNYGDVPWTMLSQLGGSFRMRGYYQGRYRDNDLLEVQAEVRQHIWRRNGVAIWVGAGNIFSDFDTFRWNQTLPNYGIGYRWEFKKRVNVRLDYGFGKGQQGFLFQISEAF